ncbi:uncharacterized protein LOC115328738 [Ixodes scapularis]|uniref:uncharacterized protein LOC115328738 n=1 Tax=Ixodes scapularis TaxID=6945 RepID=UPI001C3802CE|nr:uncharacterized protein LOC115328738 [Ixodes scapularis]
MEYYLATLGLTLSAPKSVALYNGPHRTFDLTLSINGRPLELRREATYLGLRVDDRVTWEPAVRDALRAARTTTNILRLLGGARRGTEQRMMLQLYRGLTLARVLYALPLLALTEHQWGRIEQAQRVALRVCLGVPRHASSRLTLAEAGVNTVRNTAGERALRHLIRMQETPSAASLVARISGRRAQLADTLTRLRDIAGAPVRYTAPPPPNEPPVVVAELLVSNLSAKRNVQPTVARQLTEHHCDERYHGWARLYTDGSVRDSTRTATAAAFREDTGRTAAERLTFHASSTTAELAALQLGLRLLDENEPARVVVLADSRAALGLLRSPDRSPQLAREVVARVGELQVKGWTIAFQWLPSHCGTSGNERADQLAAWAHDDPGCPLSPVPPFADARLLVRRRVALSHPELERGPLPPRLPRRLTRGVAAVLHRLRTGSSFTPAGRARWRTDHDDSCGHCGAHGDAEHLMCHCPRFSDARANLGHAYGALGCPSGTLDELLRPGLPRAGTERAFRALATYLVSTGLTDVM